METIQINQNILVVTSDSRGSGKLVNFGKELPDQIIEVGIAEQNLVGISAGLSAGGKKVFGVSPASFLTARSIEQIKNDICYSNQPVVSGGLLDARTTSSSSCSNTKPPSGAVKVITWNGIASL